MSKIDKLEGVTRYTIAEAEAALAPIQQELEKIDAEIKALEDKVHKHGEQIQACISAGDFDKVKAHREEGQEATQRISDLKAYRMAVEGGKASIDTEAIVTGLYATIEDEWKGYKNKAAVQIENIEKAKEAYINELVKLNGIRNEAMEMELKHRIAAGKVQSFTGKTIVDMKSFIKSNKKFVHNLHVPLIDNDMMLNHKAGVVILTEEYQTYAVTGEIYGRAEAALRMGKEKALPVKKGE